MKVHIWADVLMGILMYRYTHELTHVIKVPKFTGTDQDKVSIMIITVSKP